MRNISILGSTGSIGRSTLGVVDSFPEDLRVVGLAAGANVELLADQVLRYRPEVVSVRGIADAARLREILGDSKEMPEIIPGIEGACAVATLPSAHAVIAAIVGA